MRKNALITFRAANRSGIILVVVLWLVGILSVLAVGLGRRTGIDMTLTRYFLGKQRSEHLAWAGLVYTMKKIQEDSDDPQSSIFDTLFDCGIKLREEETPEAVFSNQPLGEGHFSVSSERPDGVFFGMEDEERRININAINQNNYKILSHLVSLLGFDPEAADTIASSVADWHDEDSAVTNSPYGAEENDYINLQRPYHCKNRPFENIEELFLVKGMTEEIFEKLKNYVTVFPHETGGFLLNLNTAPEIAIRALARSMTGAITNTENTDANSMTAKLVAYRKGADASDATADDRKIDMNELELNQKETVVFLAIKSQTTDVSRYLRVRSTGTDGPSRISSSAFAVVYRDDLSIVSWKQE